MTTDVKPVIEPTLRVQHRGKEVVYTPSEETTRALRSDAEETLTWAIEQAGVHQSDGLITPDDFLEIAGVLKQAVSAADLLSAITSYSDEPGLKAGR